MGRASCRYLVVKFTPGAGRLHSKRRWGGGEKGISSVPAASPGRRVSEMGAASLLAGGSGEDNR